MGKDQNLVKGLQSDQLKLQNEALELLYFRNLPQIESYIMRNSGTKEDAQEVLQDALIVVFQAVRKQGFQLTSKLDTYLYGIARNIWYKRLRKKRRRIETVPIEDQISLPDWIAPGEQPSAVSDTMLKLIRQMSPRCREILTVIYVEEKGINETKETLQYQSLQAVRNKKSSCLKKLRELFKTNSKASDHV